VDVGDADGVKVGANVASLATDLAVGLGGLQPVISDNRDNEKMQASR
jgi:hypothetical protein